MTSDPVGFLHGGLMAKKPCPTCAKLCEQVEELERERDELRRQLDEMAQQFRTIYEFADEMLGGAMGMLVQMVIKMPKKE